MSPPPTANGGGGGGGGFHRRQGRGSVRGGDSLFNCHCCSIVDNAVPTGVLLLLFLSKEPQVDEAVIDGNRKGTLFLFVCCCFVLRIFFFLSTCCAWLSDAVVGGITLLSLLCFLLSLFLFQVGLLEKRFRLLAQRLNLAAFLPGWPTVQLSLWLGFRFWGPIEGLLEVAAHMYG